jgi:hypothetical protein
MMSGSKYIMAFARLPLDSAHYGENHSFAIDQWVKFDNQPVK